MKKIVIWALLLGFIFAAGCSEEPAPTTVSESQAATFSVPQELPGVWVSAEEGQLKLTETITFSEDGSMMVEGTYQGEDAGTIFGTYRVEFDKIYCSITEGTQPFDVTYTFRIDGRELTLIDSEGEAHYLKTS